MVSNGYAPPSNSVLVLYKVSNSESDACDSLFNAFPMPIRGKAPTLAMVKRHCTALRGLNHLGAEGYHWRVCVEEKPVPGSSSSSQSAEKSFSWWDIQDENALLPMKEAYQSDIREMFAPTPKNAPATSADQAAAAAKGAFKSFGKALGAALDQTDAGVDRGPPVSVVAFKLLDLVKMNDDFMQKHGGATKTAGYHTTPAPQRAPQQRQAQQRRPAPAPAPQPARPQQRAPQQAPPAHRPQPTQQRPAVRPVRPPQAPASANSNLLDFGATPAPTARPNLHHTNSSPAAFEKSFGAVPNNETRAERLKREYAKKQQKANRVWDDVDQRWVEVDSKGGGATRGTTSAPPGAASAHALNKPAQKKEVGIKLDASSAAGKSAHVQAAVHQRVNEMQQAQAKALQEVRQREEKKKKDELEEDAVRRKLEPKIKAWSEEHGNKKQLRALLGSLHTILWPEAKWKPVSLGDILDDSKCKRCFHKASRVVHPDKTGHLDPEKRFLAKRIFDALSQAKAKMDEGGK